MRGNLLDSVRYPAFVAQRIEHLTTDQKVGGSSPSKRTKPEKPSQLLGFFTFSVQPLNGPGQPDLFVVGLCFS